MFRMHRLMQGASHSRSRQFGHPRPVDMLNKFKPAFERRLQSLDYEPGFDLDYALSQARQMTGRDDAGAHLGSKE